jgi:hypothetical protein
MANIYEEKTETLHQLLDRARSDDGATVLIPDLQRPYVWTPNQVALLMDSLIRGWPFGTLLMWKIGQGEIQNIPHRQFWRVVDRTGDGDGGAVARKDPPASYHMVLDGQQRVQSLLLALGGDAWGFKMEDRDWAEELHERRVRGRRGIYRHWSKASLCFDLDEFQKQYDTGGGLLSVDFRKVLCWVITDPADGQSKWGKPENYEEPLLRKADAANQGRFIRVSRLWKETLPNQNIKEAGFRDIAKKLFEEEAIPEGKAKKALGPMGEFMTTLRDVKLSKVTYLELIPFDANVWTEDTYNDAIVNIFTRLNTAGRTLTREEITLAWLKVGWDSTATDGKTAGQCFEELLKELGALGLEIGMDDLVSAVSVVWAASHNGGKLLENKDLLKGDIIRPMAKALAGGWNRITRSVIECTRAVVARDLNYGIQYASLNALAVLWSWNFLAVSWEETNGLKERQKDDFQKKYTETLVTHLDRWLIASQWAGRWAESSNRAMAGYAKDLNTDFTALKTQADPSKAIDIIQARMKALVADVLTDATTYVTGLSTPFRERVSVYRNVLWIWHRIDKERWKMSEIPLRTGTKKKTSLDVDHTVAHAMWEQFVNSSIKEQDKLEQLLPVANKLGNCSLLEKSFNISKSDKSLQSFMEEVHEFKEGKLKLTDWATELEIPAVMLNPEQDKIETITEAIEKRDKSIREEVIKFLKGDCQRADLV